MFAGASRGSLTRQHKQGTFSMFRRGFRIWKSILQAKFLLNGWLSAALPEPIVVNLPDDYWGSANFGATDLRVEG